MQRRSKQKSCFGCVSGKRRCDRTLPSCARCIDRGVVCEYPPPRHRAALSRLDGPTAVSSNEVNAALLFPLRPDYQTGSDAATEPSRRPDALTVLGALSTMSTSSTTTANSLPSSSVSPPAPVSSATSADTTLYGDLKWFMPPSTFKVIHHYQPPDTIPPPQGFSEFLRRAHSWLVRFQREGHSPFIHRHLYPPRAVPDCIQDAYAAIAVSEGGSVENENIVDSITFSYATRLLSNQSTLLDQSLHMITVRDHLARTQALLIHLILALSSSSISRQARAEAFIDTLHHWKVEMLTSAEQEANLAQLFPCSSSLEPGGAGPDTDPIPDLHRAFLICESVRRTWLLCSMTVGVYRSLRGDWTATCGGDLLFTARAGLWNAASSAVWADVAHNADPLFEYSLRGQEMAKKGVPALEVDEFAHCLFKLMWGEDKVENWFVRTRTTESLEQQ